MDEKLIFHREHILEVERKTLVESGRNDWTMDPQTLHDKKLDALLTQEKDI